MALYRIKNRWTGFNGAPGYSVFHFDAQTAPTEAGAQERADAVGAFNVALKGYLPIGVSVVVEPSVEIINAPDGQLQDVINITSPATQTGTAAGTYSSATGACITWGTAGIRNGRRVRGRTFLVPLNAATSFEGNGTLSNGFITSMTAAADALVGGGWDLQVYSRPSTSGATDGDHYTVQSGRINDKTAILRSRRD